MLLRDILFAAISLLLSVSAQQQGSGNLTISFFPSSDEATCKSKNINNSITLTTSSLPSGYICFNLSSTFTQPSSSGTQGIWRSTNRNDTSALGINYTLSNQDSYNPDLNYTHVWYSQVNQTGSMKPGSDGRWVFYTYAFLDCVQVGGDAFKNEEYPWFETSCQTGAGGECRDTEKSVRSFAIGPARGYNAGHGGCEVWAERGSGVRVDRKEKAVLAIVLATFVAILIL